MGPAAASGGGAFPAPPAGFVASSNPTLAQNATTNDVAHLDPLTNTWSVETPPTNFVPDPTATAPLTYVNPATGQHLQYTGYDIWIDPIDHRPPIFHHDPTTDRTAYFNPTNGQWTAPTPPPGYSVDTAQPPSRTGFFFTDGQGHTAFYDARLGQWTDWDAYQPIAPQTVERPGTGDAAGRVNVPDAGNLPTPGPETQAHNSSYSSRLMALTRGDQSVPTGTPARDYANDLKNLEDSRALRQQMIEEGASSFDIDIIDSRIADTEKYVALWNDHYDLVGDPNEPRRKFAFGGATVVNDAAQMDDLSAETKQTGEIADQAVAHGGGAFIGAVTNQIETTRIGGGGSATVVPKARTAGEYLESQGLPPRRAEPIPPGVVPPGRGGSPPGAIAPPGVPDAGAKTKTLPLGEEDGPRAARAAEKTEVGRPSAGQLDEAQQRAAGRQEAATGWRGDPNEADHLQAEQQEAEGRAFAQREMEADHNPSIFRRAEGESAEIAAARFGHETSLRNTRFDPDTAVVNLQSTRRELEEVTSGRSSTLPASERVVNELVDRYETAKTNVRDGEGVFSDYWDRMSPQTRSDLRAELDAGQGKGSDFWKGELRASQSSRGAEIGGTSRPDVPMAPVPPATTLIPSSGPHVPLVGGDGGSSVAPHGSGTNDRDPKPGTNGGPTDGARDGSGVRLKPVVQSDDPGFIGRIRVGVLTPLGIGLVVGLGALGAFGGASILGSPAHVVLVPPPGGSIAQATPPAGPLALSPIGAVVSADGQTTTFNVTITNVTGFTGSSWSLTAPSSAPDCNQMTFGPATTAVWHHGASNGCGPLEGSSQGIAGTLVFNVSDGSGFRCTATYSGSLSGTGPPSSCKGGGPTQNPIAGGGVTTPTSGSLVTQSVPASLSGTGGILGALVGAVLGLGLLGTFRRRPLLPAFSEAVSAAGDLQVASAPPIDAPPPKPIMPAPGRKKKRSCQLELDALNRADRALQQARAAAQAADAALAAAQEAQAAAQSAKDQADLTLDALQNPQPGQSVAPVREGGSFNLREIVRRTDDSGAPAAPTAEDVKDVTTSFSHQMTIGEAQRADDSAAADLAQAQANMTAAQAAANADDAAVTAAVTSYEAAREAYGACLQEQREGT